MTQDGVCRRRRGTAVVTFAAVISSLGLLVALSTHALDVPFLAGRVNDLIGTLSPAARARLETKLSDLETRTGAQVVILLIPSLEGEPLEPYSVRVAQTWKLGRKGVDDGVLFLVAKNDRKMRIEVGYGLEPKLTDAMTREILDERVRPRFRAGDFEGGVEAGVDAIASIIDGTPLARSVVPHSRGRGVMPVLPRLFMAGMFIARRRHPLSRGHPDANGHGMVSLRLPHALLCGVPDFHLPAVWRRRGVRRVDPPLSLPPPTAQALEQGVQDSASAPRRLLGRRRARELRRWLERRRRRRLLGRRR